MNNKYSTILTEDQEMLLSKFFDHECSWFERIKVRKLIEQNQTAQEFLQSIQNTSYAVQKAQPEMRVALWPRIRARLNAEDKAAVMIGKRIVYKPFFTPFTYSMVGGVACILLVGVLTVPNLYRSKPSYAQKDLSFSNTALQSVSDVNITSTEARPRSIQRGIPSAVEVDWMRSDGRLRVMHHSEERAPIIWIKRRNDGTDRQFRSARSGRGVVIVNRDDFQNITNR